MLWRWWWWRWCGAGRGSVLQHQITAASDSGESEFIWGNMILFMFVCLSWFMFTSADSGSALWLIIYMFIFSLISRKRLQTWRRQTCALHCQYCLVLVMYEWGKCRFVIIGLKHKKFKLQEEQGEKQTTFNINKLAVNDQLWSCCSVFLC